MCETLTFTLVLVHSTSYSTASLR